MLWPRIDCSGHLSKVGIGAFIQSDPQRSLLFFALQFTVIRAKQKGSCVLRGRESTQITGGQHLPLWRYVGTPRGWAGLGLRTSSLWSEKCLKAVLSPFN